MNGTSGLASIAIAAALTFTAACLSVQDYGDDAQGDTDGGDAPVDPALGPDAASPSGPREWAWLNPAPTGRTLYGIGGTSESDIWVAGEAGTIAHFDGKGWDQRVAGPDGARYFAVGTRAKGDVWVAGEAEGKIEVSHFDGKDWTKSYPFAGGAFGGFSRGPGKRLFAFMAGLNDWDILELSPSGKWELTDLSDNDVFGHAVDVWVTASGEAWAMTKGAKILRLPAGAKRWELQAPITGVPTGSLGVALAGAGSRLCAFYTGPAAGTGYAWYDGSWHTGPSDPDPLTLDSTPHGARLGCLSDGTGIMTFGGDVVVASPSAAPKMGPPMDFQGEKLFGAWSIDGSKLYGVGTLGAFMTRTPGAAGATGWEDKGPTVRKDLLAVDIGLDGAAMVANAHQPDPKFGGEVLFLKNGALAPSAGGGIAGPSIPVSVSVLGESDAWVLANDSSNVGVAHWTGKWSVTRNLTNSIGQPVQPHAIWAAAKDDVWVTADEATWHYDGSKWNEVAVEAHATYRSIHGSKPDDVWFAGDGVAHWDGKALTPVGSLTGKFTGVWSSAPGRVWLWGDRALLFDGKKTVPVETALHASAEWDVRGIAEASTGDVFVLTRKSVGTELLWFDKTHEKLVEIVSSDLELTAIRGRGDQIAAVGKGGAYLHFVPARSPR